MSSINERIRKIRIGKHYSQRALAKLMGVAQTSISFMEQEGNTVPDKNIKVLCALLHANEEYLRSGTEPMYIEPDTFSLDEFVKKHKVTSIELEILKAYFELDPEIRQTAINHFKQRFSIIDKDQNKTSEENVPNTSEELERQFPPVDSNSEGNNSEAG